jgi:23S rRNA (uracil1939-C5)-methyltransferase
LLLQIEKLVYGGDGLARLPADAHGPGKTVFVPFVISGEQVEASPVEMRPGFVRAELDKVLTPSAERIEPECPYFGRCGGCHYQHINYDAQLRYKSETLRETLRRTAKLEFAQEIQLHAAEPWHYRNRTRMRVRHAPEFVLGYHRHNSHDVLPVESCPISSLLINQAIAAVWELGREGAVPNSLHGLQFFANDDDTRLLVEVSVGPGTGSPHPTKGRLGGAPAMEEFQPFAAALRSALPQVSGTVVFQTPAAEDETQQREPLTAVHHEASQTIGDNSLIYHNVGHDYRVSGGSFFQTNRFLTETLVQIVVGDRKGRGALDLYAGTGLFTAQLARNFDSVLAVESSPQSFADLRHNVLPNVKCIRSTTEKFLAERTTRLAPDLVVVDPPRAGLGEKSARALGRMAIPRVTYVSCDPATLSRDLRVLLEFNFRVEQAHLVDMFPQTFHMETVLHLVR